MKWEPTSVSVPDLVTSLRSNLCPSCGGGKVSRQTVCRSCWSAIPRGASLYQRIGEGYEQAFASAMNALGVTELHLPGKKISVPANGRGS